MRAAALRVALILSLILPLAFMPSCGRPQQLSSITLQPTGTFTFGAADPNLFVNLRAFGTYVHPDQTKDITSQVTWQSSAPELVSVAGGKVAPTGNGCGTGLAVYAQMHQEGNDVVSPSALINISGPSSQGCTPAGGAPTLTINFGGTGLGQVISSPQGINCTGPSACSTTFTSGTTVTLTETPVGSAVFGGWLNCTPLSANTCSVFVDTTNVAVTATFN